MQRQRTIAKWLILVLIVTISIGTYFLIANIPGKDSVQASTKEDDNTVENNNQDVTDPIFTIFPRKNEVFENVSVSHIGGKSDDFFQQTIILRDKILVLFKSYSTDHDVIKQGLHMAIIEDDKLRKVMYLEDTTFNVVDTKIFIGGVAVLIKNDNASRLLQFSTDGDLTAITNVSYFDDARFYLLSNILYMFTTYNDTIFSHTVGKNLEVKKQTLCYAAKQPVIKEIFSTSKGLCLLIESDNKDTIILTFSQNNGFTFKDKVENSLYCEVDTILKDSTMRYFFLFKTLQGFNLTSYDMNFENRYSKMIYGVDWASMKSEKGILYLLTNVGLSTYCTHLDLIETTSIKFESRLSFSPDKKYILSYSIGEFYGAKADIANIDKLEKSKLFSIKNVLYMPKLIATTTHLYLSFSSNNIDDYCQSNFGGSDVFIAKISLSK